MAWYGLVDPATGDLVSVGTEAMFPDGDLEGFTGVYDVVEFGAESPDFAKKLWNSTTKKLIDRPPPVIIDRLDDIEQWLLADPDFQAAWASMSQARKAQVRNGWRRVVSKLLGAQQFRGESETVEI